MAPPPQLIDDVTAEILLRLPPDEPEHLFRAALVCKPWLHIICDPGFRRRYRAFHGAPPLLGFLHRLMVSQGDPPARFASTTSMPEFPHPGSDGRRTRPLDCRHGRVLIHMLQHDEGPYLVWDPVTGGRHYLPPEPEGIDWLIYSAAVLCATDGCDHLDCHGGPFRVVFAATHAHKDIILACDRLSMIDPPPPYVSDIALMAMENNTSLGFACIQGSSLYTWSMKVDTEEEAAKWVQYRVIELGKTIPVADPDDELFVVGFAEGVGVVFVSSGVGLFTIKLNSGQVKKVDEPGEYFSALPYMSFYLPETGNGGEHHANDFLYQICSLNDKSMQPNRKTWCLHPG
ncbi:unnamed protein product [Alopecurus aequalis]